MTEKPPIQYERPALSGKKYELRGHVVEPEHVAGMAKPKAGGIVGGLPNGAEGTTLVEVRDVSQPK